MDLKPTDFNKLKAFVTLFLKLKSIRRIPGVFTVKGLPVNKTDCLSLLRSFPELQGEVFKNDDNLSKYLSVTSNLERIISKLRAPSQRAELTSLLDLEQKAVGETMQTAEPTNNQGAPTEQIPPTGTSSPSVGSMPGMPTAPSISFGPRRVITIPHAETPSSSTATVYSAPSSTEAPVSAVSSTNAATSAPSSTSPTSSSNSTDWYSKSSSSVSSSANYSKTSATNPGLKFQTNPVNNAFKNLSSKIGTGINNGINKAISSINNFGGGTAGGITGSRSIFGKVGKFSRGGGRAVSSLGKTVKNSRGLLALIGVLGFMMLVGVIAISGTPSTGEAVPITPPGNGTLPAPTVPCTDGDYKTCLYDNYKLEFRPGTNISFSADFLQMTYQAMQSAELVAPKFKERIHDACPVITAVPTNTTSHVATCTLNLKPTIGKVAFIHELGHVIRNSNPSFYDGIIKQARVLDASYWEGGFLTYYSKFASTPDDFKTNCYPESTGGTYLLDEEFAESVTYFINKDDNEINMGPGCSVKWADNPYQGGNRYKGHYNLINNILK